jgi:hypothetical protein
MGVQSSNVGMNSEMEEFKKKTYSHSLYVTQSQNEMRKFVCKTFQLHFCKIGINILQMV